jgi:hypothetical protein
MSQIKKQLPEKIEFKKIDELKPYERNARTHNEQQLLKLAESIRTFGFTNPILVDPKMEIIAGHGRLEAAKMLGLEEVPVLVLSHLTEDEKRAYVIADNRIAEDAGWNHELLQQELQALNDNGFSLSLTGFELSEIDSLLQHGTLPDQTVTEPATKENTATIYTKKIKAPIYEIKGECPSLDELCSSAKTEQLLAEIESATVPQEAKDFLRLAAMRHNVFDYAKIAEYYAHAPKEVQELFEKSALVIVDFNKAIESGFVVLTKNIAEAFDEQA